MHKPHPPPPRPPTAAPGRRNLMSALPAVTAPSEAATAAPPPPVMVRFNRDKLVEIPINGLDAIKWLSKKHQSEQPLWLSDQSPTQLSPIDRITPPPRLAAIAKARQKVLERIQANSEQRANDRANYLVILNKQPLIPVPPSGRPTNSRSNRLGLRVPTSNSGSLDLPNEGGRTRARKNGRKGRKGTNKRRRYIVAKTRRQRRGNN